MNKAIILFPYHKNDLVTNVNLNQIKKVEKNASIVPICEKCNFLPDTYNCEKTPWQFHHSDTWLRADSLIYKYVLDKSRYIRKHHYVIIAEWDVWWNPSSSKWIEETLDTCDMAGPEVLNMKNNPQWGWFNENGNIAIKSLFFGVRPFSVIVCKPDNLITAAKYIRDNQYMHHLKNCELRFATSFNINGSKIGLLPNKYCNTIKWHEWDIRCNINDCIVHPVKTPDHLKKVGYFG
jgi:hypothetical protein